MNYKLTISFDGTNYAGWQIQPSEKTPSRVLFSDDSLSAVIIVGDDLSQVDELRSIASTPVSINFLIDALFPEIHDST